MIVTETELPATGRRALTNSTIKTEPLIGVGNRRVFVEAYDDIPPAPIRGFSFGAGNTHRPQEAKPERTNRVGRAGSVQGSVTVLNCNGLNRLISWVAGLLGFQGDTMARLERNHRPVTLQ